jgi:2-polyprenyl-3-methyl-5-hydroxy-6-metoxy-1,4-benzoquinol methylase
MSPTLREAWSSRIDAADYDAHMDSIGQAQANAFLVAEFLAHSGLQPDAVLLVVGAGTGQMFDFVSAALLQPFDVTFTDLNPVFLEKLKERLSRFPTITYSLLPDDIENTQLSGSYDAVLAVLVLEHVDFRKAVANLCHLSRQHIFIVHQRNLDPASGAMTHVPTNSMKVLFEAPPHLRTQSELVEAFRAGGFELSSTASKDVFDNKQMCSLHFYRRRL